MRHLITAIAIAAVGFTGMAYAQDDAASAPKAKTKRVRTLSPEQQKYDDCTGQAESKPREERQAFIKDCMAGTPMPASAGKAKPHRLRALTPEQQKANDCAAQAEGVARDARPEYVTKCVAGELTPAEAGPKTKAKRVKTLTPEQAKMSECAAQAAAKPRDDRVAAVKTCMGM